MLETQRELDMMQLGSYLAQAQNTLELASNLYKIVFPEHTRFYEISLDTIAKDVAKAAKVIRYECEAIVVQDDGSGNQILADGRVLR